MINNFIKYNVLGLALFFTLATLQVSAYQAGNYPKLTYATYGGGKVISQTDNIVKYAFEHQKVVPLKYNAKWRQAMSHSFYEIADIGSYELELFASRDFVTGALKLVKQFACAEYRFRHQLPETDRCNGEAYNGKKREHMPFVSGQYQDQKMVVNYPLRAKSGMLYEFTLKSGQQASLKTVWGSVHEVGTFFGKTAERRDLVLTVRVDAYYGNANGTRGEKLYPAGSLFWVLLPSAKEIASQASEKKAAEYVAKNARMLVVQPAK